MNADLKDQLKFLGNDVLLELSQHAKFETLPSNQEILREGQNVKVLPLVTEGLIKVYTRFEDRELLLYYIEPKQSCVISFSTGLKKLPSKVFAKTEKETSLLLLPMDQVSIWIDKYPKLARLFYDQYDLRYSELIHIIQDLIINKMDQRLLQYLKEKTKKTKSKNLKMSHSEIASELGTVREVVSRVIKKLELEGHLSQDAGMIKVM